MAGLLKASRCGAQPAAARPSRTTASRANHRGRARTDDPGAHPGARRRCRRPDRTQPTTNAKLRYGTGRTGGSTSPALPARGPRPYAVRWSTRQRRRYGSCNAATGIIRLSTMLQGMPDYVLDSIVVHELAHLSQADHGPEFATLIAGYPETELAAGVPSRLRTRPAICSPRRGLSRRHRARQGARPAPASLHRRGFFLSTGCGTHLRRSGGTRGEPPHDCPQVVPRVLPSHPRLCPQSVPRPVHRARENVHVRGCRAVLRGV